MAFFCGKNDNYNVSIGEDPGASLQVYRLIEHP